MTKAFKLRNEREREKRKTYIHQFFEVSNIIDCIQIQIQWSQNGHSE